MRKFKVEPESLPPPCEVTLLLIKKRDSPVHVVERHLSFTMVKLYASKYL